MPDESKRDMIGECWGCKFKRSIPGDCHIFCANMDVEMTGNPHGIRNGWFSYPLNFDPAWKTKLCCNYQPKGGDAE